MLGKTNSVIIDPTKIKFLSANRAVASTITVPNGRWYLEISNLTGLQIGKPYLFVAQFSYADTRLYTSPEVVVDASQADVGEVTICKTSYVRGYAVVVPKKTIISSLKMYLTNTVSTVSNVTIIQTI